MRIESNSGALNTGGTNSVESAAASAAAASKTAGEAGAQAVGAKEDTAQFLFDRVKSQALAPESEPQIEAGHQRVDALRKVIAEGSYNVPPEVIAGAIVAEARV